MKTWVIAVLAGGLVWPTFAHSHHNSASHYDLDKISHAEGVVTEYRMMNPHARIYFDVTSENGDVEKWMAEGDAAAVLLRRGWTGDELKPGDYIKITGNPSRDGSPIIEWRSIILPDGSELLGGNAVPVERERAMDELEKRRRAARAAKPAGE
jgi:hypothetical protein